MIAARLSADRSIQRNQNHWMRDDIDEVIVDLLWIEGAQKQTFFACPGG